MLTLHRAARTIVTDENFSVKLKWVNPCCYMDAVPGDVGMGLEIAVNEYTRTEFGNPERFEKYVTGQDRKFPDVSIRFSGALLISGTLVITDANSETYSGWLQSELGVLGTAQRDKFINEMAWPADVTFQNKSAYVPGTDDYACVTVKNNIFWDGKGFETSERIDYLDEDGNAAERYEKINAQTKEFRDNHAYIINKSNGGLVATTGAGCVISPYLFLNYLVTEMFRMNGFFVEQSNNPLAAESLQMLVYNNFNIFSQIFTTNPNTYWVPDPQGLGGKYVTIQESSATYQLGTFMYSDLVPKIALKDLVLAIQNFLNVSFLFKNDRTVKIIDRNSIPDSTPYSLDNYFLEPWRIGERKNVTLKFIQEHDNNDAYFSEEWHDLSDRRNDFKAPVPNIGALNALPSPSLGELRLVITENKIYEYKWHVFVIEDFQQNETQKDALEWVAVSIAPQYFFYGDAEEIEEIKTACSAVAYDPYTFQYPITIQRGNIASARSLWANFAFRLMAYSGSLHSEKINFDGTGGLFETRWRNWANFWKNRLPVEGKFDLPMGELYRIINNITQPYSTRHGKFIIEEIECDFQGSRMGTVKMKGYKL